MTKTFLASPRNAALSALAVVVVVVVALVPPHTSTAQASLKQESKRTTGAAAAHSTCWCSVDGRELSHVLGASKRRARASAMRAVCDECETLTDGCMNGRIGERAPATALFMYCTSCLQLASTRDENEMGSAAASIAASVERRSTKSGRTTPRCSELEPREQSDCCAHWRRQKVCDAVRPLARLVVEEVHALA